MRNNIEPIIIGLPTNTRLAEDCRPIKEALELEGKMGRFTSPYVPDAVFRTGRARDIVLRLRDNIFGLGIIGDDTALDMDLERGMQTNKSDIKLPCPDAKFTFEIPRTCHGTDWDIQRKYEYVKIIPCNVTAQNKLASFNVSDPSILSVLRRAEDVNKEDSTAKGIFLTSYPTLSDKIIKRTPRLRDYFKSKTLDSKVDGQIEAIVRNRDISNIIGGIDVVRSGKTLKEFDLVPSYLFESRTGLWTSPAIAPSQTKQMSDVLGALQERLASFLETNISPTKTKQGTVETKKEEVNEDKSYLLISPQQAGMSIFDYDDSDDDGNFSAH